MSAGDVGDLPVEDAQAVISGLPLLSMPLTLQHSILAGTFRRVRPGGSYVQFTYGPKPPVARPVREELGLTWRVSQQDLVEPAARPRLPFHARPVGLRQLMPLRGSPRPR
jgi:hypothetical protein